MYEGEPFVAEGEFGRILVAQSSGGGTFTAEVYQIRSGRKIYEWIGVSLLYVSSQLNTALDSAW